MKYRLLTLLLLSILTTNIGCSQEKIYTSAEVMPQYPGGDSEMMKYFSAIKYPEVSVENTISSRIIARFVVTKKGKVKNIEILKSIDQNFDAEFIKFIQAMPDWKPAMQDGEKVDCYYTIPMTICFQK